MRLFFACLLTVVLLSPVASLADDYNPPPWRTSPPGEGTTTFQMWEFPTISLEPDVANNNFGTPTLDIADGLWADTDRGHQGIWFLEGYLVLGIPNYPVENPYKEIWLQITFASLEGIVPEIDTLPEQANLEVIDHHQITGDAYYQATYKITIEPNPSYEEIYIQPRDCDLYIDELVIDTICVPEPATIMLLGLAGLGIVRKRRV